MGRDYTKLNVWNVAHKYALNIYKITSKFPNSEIYGLISQMRRASVSVCANIAEGCSRDSEKDYTRFLQNSLGSEMELEYYLLLVKDLKYIDNDIFESLLNESKTITRMLQGLIKSIRKGDKLTADS